MGLGKVMRTRASEIWSGRDRSCKGFQSGIADVLTTPASKDVLAQRKRAVGLQEDQGRCALPPDLARGVA